MISKDDERVVIDCPLCGKHTLNVFHSEKEMMQCLSCGYSTNVQYKYEGDKTQNEMYKGIDPAMKRWSLEANNYIWLPSILTFDSGMLYPIDKDDEMIWAFAPSILIPEDEQHKYPKEDGSGNYTARYDIENQVSFKSFDQALYEINLILETRQKIEKENEKKKTKVNLPSLKKIKNETD
tara:strand:+ start:1669 stop:2208 length:540 start_codon:yes stop_codon:yes gene_type:complete